MLGYLYVFNVATNDAAKLLSWALPTLLIEGTTPASSILLPKESEVY